MSNIEKLQKLQSPAQTAQSIAKREQAARKQRGLTQQQLSDNSGVPLGTLRRFEQTGKISFDALIRLACVLGCEADLDLLFTKPAYKSIQEVIDEQAH